MGWRSLNVTAATISHAAPLVTAPTTIPSVTPPSFITSSSPTSPTQTKIIDQVIKTISAKDSILSNNKLLVASNFFTSESNHAIHATHTFVALGNNQALQHCFLRQ